MTIDRRKKYNYDEATDLKSWLWDIEEDSVVVDLGAGKRDSPISSQIAGIKCGKLVSVEAFEPYTLFLHGASSAKKHEVVVQDVLDYKFTEQVDAVLLIDVIEHLRREDALALIHVMKAYANKIVIFTPEGDTIGYSNHDMGNKLQEHLSAWSAEDFESLGFDVVVYEDFHTHVKEYPIGAIWAVFNKT